MGASQAGPDLRGWHSLATDLASALCPLDAELAERARVLPGRPRALIGLVACAASPARRTADLASLLSAVLELGGTDCTLADVGKCTGLGGASCSSKSQSALRIRWISWFARHKATAPLSARLDYAADWVVSAGESLRDEAIGYG